MWTNKRDCIHFHSILNFQKEFLSTDIFMARSLFFFITPHLYIFKMAEENLTLHKTLTQSVIYFDFRSKSSSDTCIFAICFPFGWVYVFYVKVFDISGDPVPRWGWGYLATQAPVSRVAKVARLPSLEIRESWVSSGNNSRMILSLPWPRSQPRVGGLKRRIETDNTRDFQSSDVR